MTEDKQERGSGAEEAAAGAAEDAARSRFRKRLARFLGTFLVLWLLSFFVVQTAEPLNSFLRVKTAGQVEWVMESFGGEIVLRQGELLKFRNGRQSLLIIDECTGLFTFFVYLSLILAYPSRWREKGWGILLGLPAIWFMNLVRLLVIAYLTIHRPDLFHFVHGFLWQVSFFLFMLFIVYIWLTRIVHSPAARPAP